MPVRLTESYCVVCKRKVYSNLSQPRCRYCVLGVLKPIKQNIIKTPEPGWVRFVALFKTPEDTGVGDTVARYAAMLGGEKFKAWSKNIGMPCGCTQRQAEWNRLYPYQRSESKQGAPLDADNPGVG